MTTAESSNPPLTVSPASVITSPGDFVAFAADGGAGWGDAWLLDRDPSGATISDAGAYVAGATGGGTDVIDEAHGSVPITAPAEINSIEGGGGCHAASASSSFGAISMLGLTCVLFARRRRRGRLGRAS